MGGRRWRRKGWVTAERRLLEVVDRRVFDKPADWLAFLPEGFEPFTARDLAEAMGIRLALAQKMVLLTRSKTCEADGQAGAGQSICGCRLTRA